MANITDATGAYSNALNQLKKATGAGSGENSGAALAGKADMTDALQAITNAEMALNTVLAVRDKVIQAYEQVMRTPI